MAVERKGWTACFSPGSFGFRAVVKNLGTFLKRAATTANPKKWGGFARKMLVTSCLIATSCSFSAQPEEPQIDISATSQTSPETTSEESQGCDIFYAYVESNGEGLQEFNEKWEEITGHFRGSDSPLRIEPANLEETATLLISFRKVGVEDSWLYALDDNDSFVSLTINADQFDLIANQNIEDLTSEQDRKGRPADLANRIIVQALQVIVSGSELPVERGQTELLAYDLSLQELKETLPKSGEPSENCKTFADTGPNVELPRQPPPVTTKFSVEEKPVAVVRDGEVLGVSLG